APPLPDGATVAVEVFRPRGGAPGVETTRTAPRVEPLGVERSSGVLAFRRPPDWTGRIEPAARPEAVAVSEGSVVRSWGGSLPDESLTLSGVVKLPPAFARSPWPAVATGPTPARLRVRPAVSLSLSPGRIDVSVDAELTETAGPAHEVEVTLPGGFR